MEEIADRIKAVRKALGLTQDEFSSRIAIKRNTLAVIETQKRATSDIVLKSICREFGVNLDYLLHGEEPMFAPKDITALDKIEQYLTGDNPFVRAVFMELASLSDQEWEMMKKFLTNIMKDIKKESEDFGE